MLGFLSITLFGREAINSALSRDCQRGGSSRTKLVLFFHTPATRQRLLRSQVSIYLTSHSARMRHKTILKWGLRTNRDSCVAGPKIAWPHRHSGAPSYELNPAKQCSLIFVRASMEYGLFIVGTRRRTIAHTRLKFPKMSCAPSALP